MTKAKAKSPDAAGKAAANRTPEEQDKVLEDAKEPTAKQQEEINEAAAAAGPPAPQDDSAGTDADSEDPAKAPEKDPENDTEEEAVTPDVSGLEATTVRHADQRVGVVSSSAFNASTALGIKPTTEWTEALVKAIRSFQKGIGQKETGYLTRDQCRRLGLSYLN